MDLYMVWNVTENHRDALFLDEYTERVASLLASSRSIANNSFFEARLVPPKQIYEKIIPDMPLDPTMQILMAGHLQDRQRKRYRT